MATQQLVHRPQHDFMEDRLMGGLDDDNGFNEEEKMNDLDLGLGTPSSFTQTPSYMRMTPSGQTPGYLMRE
jgi:hypothetical protein